MKIFDNIGGKIKAVAKVFFWIGTVISILFAVSFFLGYAQLKDYSSSAATGELITGILVLVLGPLATWLSVIMMYGFGQLVENSDVLTQMPSGRYYPPAAPVTPPAKPAPVTPAAPAAAGFMSSPCARCHKTNVPVRGVTLKAGQSCVVCSDCYNALKEADVLK